MTFNFDPGRCKNDPCDQKLSTKKVPLEPTIEESELSHANTKKSEISIGNERKVSKLSFGGDDVRFYEKVSDTKMIKRVEISDFFFRMKYKSVAQKYHSITWKKSKNMKRKQQ